MQEEWRDIEGWPGYRISNLGRVLSLAKTIPRFNPRWGTHNDFKTKERMLKLHPHRAVDRHGRKVKKPPALIASLQVDNKRGHFYVHRLVLEAFCGPCPEGMEGCHNDGDPMNNRLDNLRWDTSKANKQDSIRHGTFFPKRYHGCYHPTEERLPLLTES